MKNLIWLLFVFPLTASSGGWQPATTIAQILYEGESDGSRVYIVFDSNPNPDSCSDGNAGYKRVYGNTQKGKKAKTLFRLL